MLISVALLGLVASLDPLRPAVFVLVLRTKQARLNAIGFLIGWAVALALLFSIGFLAFGGEQQRPSSGQKTWISITELVLAATLLTVAAGRWRRRHGIAPTHRTTPKAVVRQLERLTPGRSGLLGVLVQPRALTIAAALVVARDRTTAASVAAGLAVFAVFSTGMLLGLFTYFVRRRDHAESRLAALTERIEQAGPFLFTAACALGGAYLLVDGIRGLLAA